MKLPKNIMMTYNNAAVDQIKNHASEFSIEGSTRRLIAAYFVIYSCLLCLSRFSFLCFVLQVCLSCFRITLPFLA